MTPDHKYLDMEDLLGRWKGYHVTEKDLLKWGEAGKLSFSFWLNETEWKCRPDGDDCEIQRFPYSDWPIMAGLDPSVIKTILHESKAMAFAPLIFDNDICRACLQKLPKGYHFIVLKGELQSVTFSSLIIRTEEVLRFEEEHFNKPTMSEVDIFNAAKRHPELYIALKAFKSLYLDNKIKSNQGHIQQIENWLKTHCPELKGDKVRERIAQVVNPNKSGGAPRS